MPVVVNIHLIMESVEMKRNKIDIYANIPMELSREEAYKILITRKEQAIKNYKFLFERHLKDDNNYQLDHCLANNAQMFAKDIVKIDKLLEKYGFTKLECEECGHEIRSDFSMDDIPF